MISKETPKRFLEAIKLDLISIPGVFMTKKANALWHVKYVCPKCSNWRKSFRDPSKKFPTDENSKCIWYEEWKRKNYGFPRNFGIINWLKYYLGIMTNLDKYERN